MGCYPSNQAIEPVIDTASNNNDKQAVIVYTNNDKPRGYIFYSRWLPFNSDKIHEYSSSVLLKGRENIKKNIKPSDIIKELINTVNNDPILKEKVALMCQQNIAEMKQLKAMLDPNGLYIKNTNDFYNGLNVLIKEPPKYHGKHLIGLPIAAFFATITATLSGQDLFRLHSWNKALAKVLQHWCKYLESSDSNIGFRVKGEDWMNEEALTNWNPEVLNGNKSIWKYDNETIPWYNSWNSFFIRKFRNRYVDRPVSGVNNDNIIVSCNDGTLFRWRENINKYDAYWLKDMPYSLNDIFSTRNTTEQNILNKYDLVNKFNNGYAFQTFLNPFNFHRWWTCVSGKVLFKPIIIPGHYYSKLIVPDYHGSTTNSLPYLTHVNSRGIIVIDTKNYANIGYVCMIPIGMAEVSSIIFHNKKGDIITKGDEIGYFQFGGSSFTILFEDVTKYNKLIEFMNKNGKYFPKNPKRPTEPMEHVGININCGSQIAKISLNKNDE